MLPPVLGLQHWRPGRLLNPSRQHHVPPEAFPHPPAEVAPLPLQHLPLSHQVVLLAAVRFRTHLREGGARPVSPGSTLDAGGPAVDRPHVCPEL